MKDFSLARSVSPPISQPVLADSVFQSRAARPACLPGGQSEKQKLPQQKLKLKQAKAETLKN